MLGKPRNVLHFPRRPDNSVSEKYRKLAEELIMDHAIPTAMTPDKDEIKQHISGDGNIQLQGCIPISQTIIGNYNIQLALDGNVTDRMLTRLSQLVMAQAALFKKQIPHETL